MKTNIDYIQTQRYEAIKRNKIMNFFFYILAAGLLLALFIFLFSINGKVCTDIVGGVCI